LSDHECQQQRDHRDRVYPAHRAVPAYWRRRYLLDGPQWRL